MRHYFPGIDIDELDDEEFAVISNDAEWLHSKQIIARQANILGIG